MYIYVSMHTQISGLTLNPCCARYAALSNGAQDTYMRIYIYVYMYI